MRNIITTTVLKSGTIGWPGLANRLGTIRTSGHKTRSDQKYAESTQLHLEWFFIFFWVVSDLFFGRILGIFCLRLCQDKGSTRIATTSARSNILEAIQRIMLSQHGFVSFSGKKRSKITKPGWEKTTLCYSYWESFKTYGKTTFPGDGRKAYKRPLRCPNDGIYCEPLKTLRKTSNSLHNLWAPPFRGRRRIYTCYSYRETLENHWKSNVFRGAGSHRKVLLPCVVP